MITLTSLDDENKNKTEYIDMNIWNIYQETLSAPIFLNISSWVASAAFASTSGTPASFALRIAKMDASRLPVIDTITPSILDVYLSI